MRCVLALSTEAYADLASAGSQLDQKDQFSDSTVLRASVVRGKVETHRVGGSLSTRLRAVVYRDRICGAITCLTTSILIRQSPTLG